VTHTCEPTTPRGLFCRDCGRVLDRDALRSVKLFGFMGPASLVPSIERFWETGDPEGV
jgi:hypothetical protein